VFEGRTIFIVIDALDECSIQSERQKVLELLAVLLRSLGFVRVICTSQPLHDIELALEQDQIRRLVLSGKIMRQDIESHVQRVLALEYPFITWPHSALSEVEDYLIANADSGFRWVHCQLESLKNVVRAKDISTILAGLPRTLSGVYTRILQGLITEDNHRELLAALHWLAFSISSISTAHFNDILRFELRITEQGSNSLSPQAYHHSDVILGSDQMRRVLPRLISTSGTDHVSFEHFSVKQYLMSDEVRPEFRLIEGESHRLLFESCVVCLHSFLDIEPEFTPPDFGSVVNGECRTEPEIPSIVLYAAWHYHRHAHHMLLHQSESPRSLQLLTSMFHPSPDLYHLTLRIRHASKAIGVPYRPETTTTPAQYASPAWFLARENEPLVLVALAQSIPSSMNSLGINEPFLNNSGVGWPALFNAVQKRNKAMIQTLLDLGADIHFAELVSGMTALHRAAHWSSDDDVATTELLLSRGANTERLDKQGQTPLHAAAGALHEGIVRTLVRWWDLRPLVQGVLREDGPQDTMANKSDWLNQPDGGGNTPLLVAAGCVGWSVAKICKTCKVLFELGCEIDVGNSTMSEEFGDVFARSAVKWYEIEMCKDLSARPGVAREALINKYTRELRALVTGWMPELIVQYVLGQMDDLEPWAVTMQG
jgi:hypothetical protein